MAEKTDQESLSIDVSALVTALQFGNQQSASIAEQIKRRFGDQAANLTSLSIAFSTSGGGTGTLVSSGRCYLVMVSVTTASTGTTGLCYDSASAINAGSSNAFMVIQPSGVQLADWPCLNGLVVQPSSQGSHTVSVSYVLI